MQFSSACLYHKMFHDFHLSCFLPATVSLQILFINREIVPDPSTTLTYARTRCSLQPCYRLANDTAVKKLVHNGLPERVAEDARYRPSDNQAALSRR